MGESLLDVKGYLLIGFMTTLQHVHCTLYSVHTTACTLYNNAVTDQPSVLQLVLCLKINIKIVIRVHNGTAESLHSYSIHLFISFYQLGIS